MKIDAVQPFRENPKWLQIAGEAGILMVAVETPSESPRSQILYRTKP